MLIIFCGGLPDRDVWFLRRRTRHKKTNRQSYDDNPEYPTVHNTSHIFSLSITASAAGGYVQTLTRWSSLIMNAEGNELKKDEPAVGNF